MPSVESEMIIRVPRDALHSFAVNAFCYYGVPDDDARIAADVLLESDLRGIESHGVPRLEQFYLARLRDGRINPTPQIKVLHESPSTALVDADGGLGMVTGFRSMKIAIEKAKVSGTGFVSVTNARHFGIAGYYSSMALEEDMIGIAMCNTSAIMVPTFGRDAKVGTNAFSVAAPSADGRHFILDMATSTVSAGKFEVAARKGQPVPIGWAGDADGVPTTDPSAARDARHYSPLGGAPEMSSHKGYGLGVVVDILCGILSGVGPSAALVSGSGVGHFFGAIRVDGFRDPAEFRAMMTEMMNDLRSTRPADGYERVYVAGDREHQAKEERLRLGIPLYPDVVESIRRVSLELGIESPV
ncbi:MAG: Ldh family oxidoreductase [Dehalococcoidia bacterium]|nr:Ldh family oxidoreductase [Dehalococcoidia bacterium]